MNTSTRTATALLLLLLMSILIVDLNCEKTAAQASQKNLPQTIQTNVDGKNVTLTINGNVSVTQITDLTFYNSPDNYNNTNINFVLRGLNGSAAFINMTIPKSALLKGTEPVIVPTGDVPEDSHSFSQDENNFYVWFTTLPEWNYPNFSPVTVNFMLVYHHQHPTSPFSALFYWGIPIAILAAGTSLILIGYKQKHRKMPS